MAKNIVVCLDGTRNQNETQNTNVHRIYGMVDKECSVANYLSGVGVGGRMISNALDSLGGRGLFRTVRTAYTFVQGNYLPGDRIFIFGFSRGAYAARHLAGMIVRLGFGLPSEQTYDRYRDLLRDGGRPMTQQPVEFLGMFDCVAGNQLYSLRPDTRILNDPRLETGILNVAHAISKDDRRFSFEPLIFVSTGQTRFSQVWLPGCHFDLGGDRNPGLNAFALLWMLREAYAAGLELTLMKCPGHAKTAWQDHGKPGGRDGFIASVDSAAPGNPTEYWTTRLGLRCKRAELEGAASVSPLPNLLDMDVCPRLCGVELFDYFGTAEGARSICS